MVDAAPAAKAVAKELAVLKSNVDTNLSTAKQLRAQGRDSEASSYEDAARTLVRRLDDVHRAFIAQFPNAHADAAYGLGVQYALHHALRAELGKESPLVLEDILGQARAHCAIQVRG